MSDISETEQIELDSQGLASLIRATLTEATPISFDAPGRSMEPFIRSGDKIFVSRVTKPAIRRGDVLVYVHPQDGKVIAHRVIRIDGNHFLCKGDNVHLHDDGWIDFQDVLGRVRRVERNGKRSRLGFGPEKFIIALLSKQRLLVPVCNLLRRSFRWLVARE